MRVLMVTLGFYPATAWGGPVKIVYQTGRELVSRGHHVTVYCTNLLDKRRKIRPGTFERQVAGMRVVYFDTWCLPWWPGTLGPFWLPDLPGSVQREIASFDLVHLHGSRSFMVLPVVSGARKAGVPFVVQPHGTLPVASRSFLGKRLYDRLLGRHELRSMSALIALQKAERQQALARGVPAELIKIIPNGLELSERAALPTRGGFRNRFSIPGDKPLILFLGRINKLKGVDMLVEAFALMDGLDAHLAIVGPDDGQLRDVKRSIRQHKLDDRVLVSGLLPESDVMAAYRDADLFALPCRADAFPTTIMEACLADTPMVITDRCEIAHLVQGRVADVVSFDAGAFAQAIRRLLTDGERYQTYRENCPRVMAQEFSLQAVVDRLEGLYQTVISKRSSGAGQRR